MCCATASLCSVFSQSFHLSFEKLPVAALSSQRVRMDRRVTFVTQEAVMSKVLSSSAAFAHKGANWVPLFQHSGLTHCTHTHWHKAVQMNRGPPSHARIRTIDLYHFVKRVICNFAHKGKINIFYRKAQLKATFLKGFSSGNKEYLFIQSPFGKNLLPTTIATVGLVK